MVLSFTQILLCGVCEVGVYQGCILGTQLGVSKAFTSSSFGYGVAQAKLVPASGQFYLMKARLS